MKKFLKRLGVIALAALTCLTIGFMQKPENASAVTSAQSSVLMETMPLLANGTENDLDADDLERIKLLERSDKNFHFTNGCKVNLSENYEGAEPLSALRFGIVLDNEDLLSLEDGDTAYATFTLYRGGETVKPLYRIMIFHAWNLIGMAHSHISGDGETGIISMQNSLHVSPSQKVGDAIIDPNDPESWKQVSGKTHVVLNQEERLIREFIGHFRDNNYILDFVTVRGERGNVNQPIIFEEVDGALQLYFDIVLNSFDAKYFCTFNYEYSIYSASIYEHGAIKSVERSIGQVLMNMQEAGALESELYNNQALIGRAEDIINSVLGKEKVTVEYLEQIGDSPFAKKVTAEVTVPVLNKQVKKDDVELQIKKNTDCMGSFLEKFSYNETRNVYESTYCTSSIGYVRTASGDTKAIPLDINQSYLSFYHPFVEAGCMTSEEASYIWNTALSNHEEDLRPYSDRKDEVYGLWGYVLVPDGYTISDIWKNIMSKDNAYDSFWPMYTIKTKMRTSDYWDSLGGYHQNYWTRIWNTVSSWFSGNATNATHVFFYADARKQTAVMSGTGTTDINDTNSLLMNDAQEATKMLAEGLTAAAKNISNTIKNSNPFRFVKMLIKIIFYGLGLVVIVWFALKVWSIMRRAFSDARGGTKKK